MINLWFTIQKNGKNIRQYSASDNNPDANEAFLSCINRACKEFDIEVPMWQTKHTKQLNTFRKIEFLKDDFIDCFPYDKFIIEVIDFDS